MVHEMHIFRSLDELFDEIPPRVCGVGESISIKKAVSQIENYYQDDGDELSKLSVVAFRLHIMEGFNSNSFNLLEYRFQEERRRNNYRYIIDCR